MSCPHQQLPLWVWLAGTPISVLYKWLLEVLLLSMAQSIQKALIISLINVKCVSTGAVAC